MDLGRWSLQGIRKISRLSDRYRDLHTFLGEVLEGEPAERSEAVVRVPFRLRDDLESILELKFPKQGKGSAREKFDQAVFEALAPFFEAGFRLSRERGVRGLGAEAKLHSMFMLGRAFQTAAQGGAALPFQLPVVGPDRVLRARARPLLKKMDLDAVEKLHDASAFMCEPSPGTVYILICDRPHPWQVGVIEATQGVLQELFSR